MIRLAGFDDAVVGRGHSHGMEDFLIYSEAKILEILTGADEEMTLEDAVEHMEYNIKGGYFGEGNPVFLIELEDWEMEELLPQIGEG